MFIKQRYAHKVNLISLSKRYIILLVDNLLLINVYLPCISTVDRVDEYIECLASIMNDISELQFSDVIFGGDLNMELNNKAICVNSCVVLPVTYRCSLWMIKYAVLTNVHLESKQLVRSLPLIILLFLINMFMMLRFMIVV